MFCTEFEDHLTDYLDGTLASATQHAFSEHAMRCPVCHELLSEVKLNLSSCRNSIPPHPPATLEARILLQTFPESAMTCPEFEEHVTDYLDGFLAASVYQRWARHAALCDRCTDLPGQVVRSIGACYSYMKEERPLPHGLHEKILEATLGTTDAAQLRAPIATRLLAWVKSSLDALAVPQLATVTTMVMVVLLIGTSTISEDGSISGMYRASLRLAAQTYTEIVDQSSRLQVQS